MFSFLSTAPHPTPAFRFKAKQAAWDIVFRLSKELHVLIFVHAFGGRLFQGAAKFHFVRPRTECPQPAFPAFSQFVVKWSCCLKRPHVLLRNRALLWSILTSYLKTNLSPGVSSSKLSFRVKRPLILHQGGAHKHPSVSWRIVASTVEQLWPWRAWREVSGSACLWPCEV